MGLLDEAIREHLELKRRHGASPGEVAHLEEEALGPPRAQPEPVETDAAAADELEAAHVPAEPAVAVPDAAVAPPPPSRVVGGAVRMDDYVVEHPDPEPRPAAPPASAAPDADADDVLEETPEFLQETPEHERLWFEQKPPKDFDF